MIYLLLCMMDINLTKMFYLNQERFAYIFELQVDLNFIILIHQTNMWPCQVKKLFDG